jgi:Fe-S-cluster containining protein
MDEQGQETVSVEFSVRVGDGQFTANAVVPTGHTNLTQILPVIQSLESSFIRVVEAQLHEAGRSISCKAGCAACCRQMVPLSIFEAEALSAWIATLPEERAQALLERFHRTLLALRDAGLIDRIVDKDWVTDGEARTRLALTYFRAGVPCPFLEDENCTIHPIRPLACREYLVSSPPEFCADPSTLPIAPVHLRMQLSRVLFGLGSALEQDPRGWIPLVFLPAWMKSGAHPGEAIAGTGPEVLFEFVKHLRLARNSRFDDEESTESEPGTVDAPSAEDESGAAG